MSQTIHDLAIPYDMKDEIKAKHFIKFNKETKGWYYIGEVLPEGLKRYKRCEVDISYEEKEVYKSMFNSLKWDASRKTWTCSVEDCAKIYNKGI